MYSFFSLERFATVIFHRRHIHLVYFRFPPQWNEIFPVLGVLAIRRFAENNAEISNWQIEEAQVAMKNTDRGRRSRGAP